MNALLQNTAGTVSGDIRQTAAEMTLGGARVAGAPLPSGDPRKYNSTGAADDGTRLSELQRTLEALDSEDWKSEQLLGAPPAGALQLPPRLPMR